MNLVESAMFAAIMTLLDEVKSKEVTANDGYLRDTYGEDNTSTELPYDASKVKYKLCQMAQEIFDQADKVSQTKQIVSADQLILPLINGIIFETVDALDKDDDIKREIYEFALQYCTIDNGFQWEVFCAEDDQLTDELKDELLNLEREVMESIVVASNRGNMENVSLGFFRMLSEFMLYLEESIIKNFSTITLPKRPPLIALDLARSALEKEMKRMEEEDPSVKEQENQTEEQARVEELFNKARTALDSENRSSAEAYYREILEIEPNNWEAMFYSTFCSVYRTTDTVNVASIPYLTSRVIDCVPNVMKEAKKCLFTQMEVLTEVGKITSSICSLASKYFVASMTAFKSSFGGSTANTNKVQQVNSIINMVFVVGDSIEENFGDTFEVANKFACMCWEIGFTCYESCDMPTPQNLREYYAKMIKYEPSFRCSKPLVGSSSTNSSEGCYIATAIYGSYDCPQVWTLRRFRDYSLAKTMPGRTFIKVYYAISPTLVKWFGETKWFKALWGKVLDKMVTYLQQRGVEDTPYNDR